MYCNELISKLNESRGFVSKLRIQCGIWDSEIRNPEYNYLGKLSWKGQENSSERLAKTYRNVWPKCFVGVCFCRLVMFCVLSGLDTNFSTY